MKKGTPSPRKGLKAPRQYVIGARKQRQHAAFGVFAQAGRFFCGASGKRGMVHFA